MYHVNPKRFGPIPINMDTADAAGDLFFEMMESLIAPLECSDPARDPRSHFACDNPEADDPTDVINKLTVEVTGGYSEYALCNIGRNGIAVLETPAKTTPTAASASTSIARIGKATTTGRRRPRHAMRPSARQMFTNATAAAAATRGASRTTSASLRARPKSLTSRTPVFGIRHSPLGPARCTRAPPPTARGASSRSTRLSRSAATAPPSLGPCKPHAPRASTGAPRPR